MVPHVVVRQRLLDHHEIESVEFFEERNVFEAVRGIRVDHEGSVGKPLPNGSHDIAIPAWLDLDLDTSIAAGQFGLYLLQQLPHAFLDSDRNPRLDLGPGASQRFGKRLPPLAGEGVPTRHLHRGLSHVVAPNQI